MMAMNVVDNIIYSVLTFFIYLFFFFFFFFFLFYHFDFI